MPLLGLSIVPRPGELVIWHNVDRDGNLDQRSYHGGCKVMAGYKIAGSTVATVLDQDATQCLPLKGLSKLRDKGQSTNTTLCKSLEH